MRMLALAIKDLLQIVRDWKAAVFLLVSPILFTLFFGFLFSEPEAGESDNRIPVLLVDLDRAESSAVLSDLLSGSTVIRFVQPDQNADM